MNLVFLGPPGSGKGTQAALLAGEFGLVHFSTGDLFRRAVQRGEELGKKVKGYLESGMLVPDDLVVAVVSAEMSALKEAKGFILDGFPRTLEQAKALDSKLKEQGKKADLIIYFDISKEEVVKRLSSRRVCSVCQAPYNLLSSPPKQENICDHCGGRLYQREDDKEEVILKRFKVYLNQTAPLLDYYKDRLVRVDANKVIEEVTYNLRRILSEKSEQD